MCSLSKRRVVRTDGLETETDLREALICIAPVVSVSRQTAGTPIGDRREVCMATTFRQSKVRAGEARIPGLSSATPRKTLARKSEAGWGFLTESKTDG